MYMYRRRVTDLVKIKIATTENNIKNSTRKGYFINYRYQMPDDCMKAHETGS